MAVKTALGISEKCNLVCLFQVLCWHWGCMGGKEGKKKNDELLFTWGMGGRAGISTHTTNHNAMTRAFTEMYEMLWECKGESHQLCLAGMLPTGACLDLGG